MLAVESIPFTTLDLGSRSSVAQSLDPRGFERVLAGAATADQREVQARSAAQDLVSIALVQPTLQLLRDANGAAPPFAPGPAEKTFGAFLDAEIARNVAHAGAGSLVDAIARRMTERIERAHAPAEPFRRPEVDVDG